MREPVLLAVLAIASVWAGPGLWALMGALVATLAALLLVSAPPEGQAVRAPLRWIVPILLWISLGLTLGWDRGQGLGELALAGLVLAVLTAASRHEPGEASLLLFGVGVALLSLWALWQTLVGFELARAGLSTLPETVRNAALFRLDSGRAFASQLHPGHLGILLATVVPLAGGGIAQRRFRVLWTAALLLSSAGLVLTRSPLAMALAVAALLVTLRPLGRSWILPAAALSLVLLAVVLSLRPDLLHLDPIVWRLQNWHNALWVWTGAPVTGVGLGGFGQAALGVPFPVPNHPLHAHNLPLEWLAEMGLPGLLFAVLFYSWVLTLARRLWPRHRGLAVAILLVPLHNLADFSLFEPGIAVAWAVLAAWALASSPGHSSRRPAGRRSPVAVVAALGAALFFGLSFASTAWLNRAGSLPATGETLRAQISAFELAPWQPFPPSLALAVQRSAGPQAQRLAKAIRQARRWRPHSATLARLASMLAARHGDLPAAAGPAWEARAFSALDRRVDRDPGAAP